MGTYCGCFSGVAEYASNVLPAAAEDMAEQVPIINEETTALPRGVTPGSDGSELSIYHPAEALNDIRPILLTQYGF